MIKLPFQNSLGKSLSEHRKSQGLTLAVLAAEANLSAPTIRQLERGHGNLSSWNRVLDTFALEVGGRNLPPGEHSGVQVTKLRLRKQLSQRELAAIIHTSQPTLVAMERHNRGRLDVLQRILSALGTAAYLTRQGSAKPFYTHAGNTSSHHAWQTPQEILLPLYSVFGTFDLDPCSPTNTRRTAPVKARVHYTADDDGLSLPWFGDVFVNPPYGREIPHWIAKAHREVELGNAQTVVALIPARTDTAYWHEHVATQADVFFLRGRLKFGQGSQSAPFPSALAVWGGSVHILTALQQVLPDAWQA